MKRFVAMLFVLVLLSVPCFSKSNVGDDWTDFEYSAGQFYAQSCTWNVPAKPRTYQYKIVGDTVFINITMYNMGQVYCDAIKLVIALPNVVKSSVVTTPEYYMIGSCGVVYWDGVKNHYLTCMYMYNADGNYISVMPPDGMFPDNKWPAWSNLGVNIVGLVYQLE